MGEKQTPCRQEPHEDKKGPQTVRLVCHPKLRRRGLGSVASKGRKTIYRKIGRANVWYTNAALPCPARQWDTEKTLNKQALLILPSSPYLDILLVVISGDSLTLAEALYLNPLRHSWQTLARPVG